MSAGRKFVLIAIAAAVLAAACGRRSERSEHPPVILISIDTLRADHLSMYGGQGADTPALARLAADGILFENAYSHVPLTLPSHVSMITGRLPYENGVRSNIGYRLDPADSHPTLPRLLAANGYATGAAISAYVLRRDTGLAEQFEFYDDSLEVTEAATLGALQRSGDDTVRAATKWLDGVQAKPFFLLLHLFEPHSPYNPPEPFLSRYANPYDGEIAAVDAIVGRFLADLDRRGLYDKSLIIVTGDHGEGLGDHGEAEHGVLLYREVLHVPLIVKLPSREKGGTRVKAPAQLIDIAPTVLRAAGVAIPAEFHGTSLTELAGDRAIYSETLYPRLHLGWSQLRSLTDAKNQYIEGPAPELYDITSDPRETKNIRSDERRRATALSAELSKVPLNLQQLTNVSAEERARLAALGYLSGTASDPAGPLRNPRDHVAVLAKFRKTFVLAEEGRYQESIDLCREILREDPDLVDVYSKLAGNLRHVGRTEEALKAYKEVIRRSPQIVDSVAIEIANLELDRGDLKAAELNAQQAMKMHGQEAHLVLAAVAEARNDLPAAEREARLAFGDEARPRIPALIVLARIQVAEKKLDEALATIDRAAQRAAETGARVPTISSTRGDILARMGRASEAEAAFRDEIAHFPRTVDAYTRLALLLASQHRFNEIKPTLDAMVKASPMPATYFLAAREMHDLGNDVVAREYRSQGEAMLR